MVATQATDADVGRLAHRRLGYWNARRQMIYYQALYQFVCVVGRSAESLIDVGSASAQYVEWFSWIPSRHILDFRIAKKPEGITCIESDFLAYEPQRKFDVVLCLQVLEHVPDPSAFCAKLKSIGRQLLVSVPYKWVGGTPGHIHDPVDEKKLKDWMGITPNNSQIVTEPFRESRLIAHFDLENGPSHRFDKSYIQDAIREQASEH
jgi:methyltransferase family protein